MGIKRQFIYWVNLSPTIGKEIEKTRPCLVLSSNIYNNNSGLVTVVPLTSTKLHKITSTQVSVYKTDGCVDNDSKIKADQIRTLDLSRFNNEIGKLPNDKYEQVKKIIKKHLNL